jgi:hypothetical protein
MSVPLDRLYNFLQSLCNRDDIIIYRYYPHGSKNIADCFPVDGDIQYSDFDRIRSMHMICHDQEPLMETTASFIHKTPKFKKSNIEYSTDPAIPTSSFKAHLNVINSVYDEMLLVHSERNSPVVSYLSTVGCRPVYYWSHAVIAGDWYRFAEHDPDLEFNPTQIKKDFLIYNRAWSGTREYRLKFAELIVKNNLATACHMKFNPIDSNMHYQQHWYKNSDFKISTELGMHFPLNETDATVSADYVAKDYESCGIEVVLETLFDDQRNHLTEKSLRPIACGRPFIIAATPGSLAYLRSYGFETFGEFIDESYDTITDPVSRLQAIVDVMHHVSNLPQQEKILLWNNLNHIAQRNRQRFFGTEFFDQVIGEFKLNLAQAIQQTQQHRSGLFYQQWLAAQSSVPLTSKELSNIASLINVASQSSGGGVC